MCHGDDEYTYYASGNPPLAGASVTLTRFSDGSVVAQGLTGLDGTFSQDGLMVGYYVADVTADGHGECKLTILVSAGATTDVEAFLPLQTVTYTWSVVPVQTQDQYQITLQATFETNVPAPVITVDPMVLDLTKVQFDSQGTAVVNYTISNNGLIAVNNTTLDFGSNSSYQVTPLCGQIGDVPAMSSIVVPVTVTQITGQAASAAVSKKTRRSSTLGSGRRVLDAGSDDDGCHLIDVVGYTYVCGGDRPGSVVFETIVGDGCGSAPMPGIGGGDGGGGISLPQQPVFVQPAPCSPSSGGGSPCEDTCNPGSLYGGKVTVDNAIVCVGQVFEIHGVRRSGHWWF